MPAISDHVYEGFEEPIHDGTPDMRGHGRSPLSEASSGRCDTSMTFELSSARSSSQRRSTSRPPPEVLPEAAPKAARSPSETTVFEMCSWPLL